ncbi:rod shape-determining protein MreC [Patescibacteria group bacterium]|nr:MAG: rod shape-determining protein MreC [Patescibacteria group bacterium]
MRFPRAFTIILVVLAFVVLTIFFIPAIRGVGSRILGGLGSPLWSVGLSVRNFFFWDKNETLSKLQELETERNRLIIENSKLRDLQSENETLRRLLAFKKKTEALLLPAQVIAGSSEPDLHTLEIDAGSDDGVAVGDAVISADGLAVGKIREAGANTSRLELLTDRNSRFAAALLGLAARSVIGVVEGGHGTAMIMRLIPEDVSVSLGDTVVTSGLEAGIPRGLLLGRVESVKKEANEPFQTASLSPLLDLTALSVVAVIHLPR